MFPFLDPLQPTALPALFFLVWLPVFLGLRPQYSRTFFIIAGWTTLAFVGGPPLAIGLSLIILAAYGLIELVARLPHRLPAAILLLVALHAAYWACFHVLLPGGYAALHPDYGPGVFLFFSGVGLTFIRVIGYFWDRIRLQAPPLAFRDYLAYMFFFPQFRHGPLERAHIFAPSLARARQHWTPADVRAGMLRIVAGLALGTAILSVLPLTFPATHRDDPWGYMADSFSHPEHLSFARLLLLIHLPALVGYVLESASAHLELGVSRVFGLRGSENFHYPFLSTDPILIWRRWNITFSRWLFEYVYVPLGRYPQWRYPSIMVVFVYCGLLHGLRLNFVAWGLWTGSTIVFYHWLSHRRTWVAASRRQRPWLVRQLMTALACLATFHWFCLGGIIFLDAQYCGLRVLREYLHRLVSLVM